jgi:hypothetical protein
MPEARVLPNEITYSATISACGNGAQWQLALNLLSVMPEARAVLDRITYSATISACSERPMAAGTETAEPDARSQGGAGPDQLQRRHQCLRTNSLTALPSVLAKRTPSGSWR